MGQQRHLRVEGDEGRAIVHLMDQRVQGAEVVEQLADELLALLSRPGMRRLVLDLADVRLLSSAALDRIVVLHRRAEAAGVELELMRLRPEVREVLELTGLGGLLARDGEPEGVSASGTRAAPSSQTAGRRKKSGRRKAATDKRKKNRRR